MRAKTIKAETTDELAAKLAQETVEGFNPTLALVFCSIRQDHDAISHLLDSHGIQVFGATTAGEFIDGDVTQDSAVIMLLDIDPQYFRIGFFPIGNNDQQRLAQHIGKTGKAVFDNPAFMLSYSGFYTDGELLVRGMEESAGAEAVIFGGMAGDNLTWQGPCVFTNGKSGDNAVLTIIIDGDKIALKGHASSGWKPVGTVRTITRSEGSVVYAIDEEPALDVVMRFMGANPETPAAANEVLKRLGAHFPILLQRADGAQVVRTSMFGDAGERSIKFSGNVPQGSRFRFSMPPDFDVIHDVIAQSGEMKKNLLPDADALVLFSCAARLIALGPMVSEEIDGLKNLWGAPLIGFFSYGEIGKAHNGRNEFHNNTCCLVALKEKERAAP